MIQASATRPASPAPESTPSSKSVSGRDPQAHVILSNKGGIGKTLVASYLIQHIRSKGVAVQPFDIDPLNLSLTAFTGLGVRPVSILSKNGLDLNVLELDSVAVEMLTGQADVVVDSGAASFKPFANYLLEIELPAMMADRGRELIIHMVIAGGDLLSQCVGAVEEVADSFGPPVKLVIWLNEHFGPVEASGIQFEDMELYGRYKDRFRALVRLPALGRMFIDDFKRMTKARLTFDEAIASPDFHVLNKQRLVMIRRDVFRQLDRFFS